MPPTSLHPSSDHGPAVLSLACWLPTRMISDTPRRHVDTAGRRRLIAVGTTRSSASWTAYHPDALDRSLGIYELELNPPSPALGGAARVRSGSRSQPRRSGRCLIAASSPDYASSGSCHRLVGASLHGYPYASWPWRSRLVCPICPLFVYVLVPERALAATSCSLPRFWARTTDCETADAPGQRRGEEPAKSTLPRPPPPLAPRIRKASCAHASRPQLRLPHRTSAGQVVSARAVPSRQRDGLALSLGAAHACLPVPYTAGAWWSLWTARRRPPSGADRLRALWDSSSPPADGRTVTAAECPEDVSSRLKHKAIRHRLLPG